MFKIRVLVIAAAAVLMAACAASGPKVRTDRDPTADLSSYKTFGFYDQLLGDRARYSTIMSNRMRAATIEQMTKLGYTYDVRAPQLRVNFFLQVSMSGRRLPPVSVRWHGAALRATSRPSATRPGRCASIWWMPAAARPCGRAWRKAGSRKRRCAIRGRRWTRRSAASSGSFPTRLGSSPDG
jgi:hypothetical protein